MVEQYQKYLELPFPELEKNRCSEFLNIAKDKKQLQQNIEIVSNPPMNSQFLYYERKKQNPSVSDKRDQLLERAAISGNQQTLELNKSDFCELLSNSFSEKCECGNVATTVYFCENCGGFKFCEDCFDATVFYNHADHNCSKECCAAGHQKVNTITESELEALIPKIEVSMIKVRETKSNTIFLVNTRKRSLEKIEELKIATASDYFVSDWPYVTEIEFEENGDIETIEGDLSKPYLQTIDGIRKVEPFTMKKRS